MNNKILIIVLVFGSPALCTDNSAAIPAVQTARDRYFATLEHKELQPQQFKKTVRKATRLRASVSEKATHSQSSPVRKKSA